MYDKRSFVKTVYHHISRQMWHIRCDLRKTRCNVALKGFERVFWCTGETRGPKGQETVLHTLIYLQPRPTSFSSWEHRKIYLSINRNRMHTCRHFITKIFRSFSECWEMCVSAGTWRSFSAFWCWPGRGMHWDSKICDKWIYAETFQEYWNITIRTDRFFYWDEDVSIFVYNFWIISTCVIYICGYLQ